MTPERIRVRNRDIIACARATCKVCFGKGEVVKHVQKYIVKGDRQIKQPIRKLPRWVEFKNPNVESNRTSRKRTPERDTRHKEICGCAWATFTTLQPTEVDESTGALYYKGPALIMSKESALEGVKEREEAKNAMGTAQAEATPENPAPDQSSVAAGV